MNETWAQVKEDLSHQMTERVYNELIKDTQLLAISGGGYTIGVPSHQIRERIEGRLNDLIVRALSSVVGKPVKVAFRVAREEKPIPRVTKPTPPLPDEDLPGSVRDKRKPGRYYIDTRFIRGGYAAKVGQGGIAVYNVLAASADNDYQDCFPSYGKIAELSGISKSQAIKKARALEELNIITIEVRPHPENPKINDSCLFTLIDDEEWYKIK